MKPQILLLEEPCKQALDIIQEVADTFTPYTLAVDIYDSLKITGIFTKLKKLTPTSIPLGVKFIACPCTGIDHITSIVNPGIVHMIYLDDVWKMGKGLKITSTAEHTLSLILQLAKKKKMQLNGRTLGIIGYGRIGKMVGQYARALGMHVNWYNAMPGYERFIGYETIRASDIITLHVPLTQANYHLVNSGIISKMKQNVLLINTSRPEIIDTEALVENLISGKIGGYADDFEGESGIDYLDLDVIQTPHIGGNCIEAREATDIYIANKIVEYIRGL